MDELYKEFILELNRNPLHKKELASFDIDQLAINRSCGDSLKVQIKFDENKNIVDVGFQGHGCAISQAGISLLLDNIKGKNIAEVIKYDEQKMTEIFGTDIMYSRKKCLMLGMDALVKGLAQYKDK